MLTASLLAGAVAGLGCYALLRVFLRPRPGVAALVARIDGGQRSLRPHTATALELQRGLAGSARSGMQVLSDRLETGAAERGWKLSRVRKDLALLNRSVGSFLATKIVLGLVFFLLAPVVYTALRTAGVPLPGGAPLVAAVVFGAFGFFLPDLALKGEADRRRRAFRRVVGVFLDLVAMNLAGGRGLPEALLAASSISDHWAVVRIRQSLANARLMGSTPWQALGDLGDELGLDELRDLAGALGLAADDGAKIRSSLSARAATLRRKEMAESEGEAGERSQSMLVAQLLVCSAFLLFLAFPAIDRLLGV
ncbi:MAG: type II secretion system F family protein [Frankiales bacterium]|nr:type II secretion system F family protein [Frankiales bacterium]